MKTQTVTHHVSTDKLFQIAFDIVTGLLDREDLAVWEIVSIWLNINGIMESFLKSRGITINSAINKLGENVI